MITLEWSHPALIRINHFAFSPEQNEGPWTPASRLLIYVRSGKGDIFRNGRRIKLVRGDYYLMEWGEPVRYIADAKDPFALITSHFIPHMPPGRPTPEFLHTKSPRREYQDNPGNVQVAELNRIASHGSLLGMPHVPLMIERLIEEEQRPTEVAMAIRTAYIKAILAELVALSSHVEQINSHPRMADVLRVREYLDRNFKEPLTREWMADMAGMSPAHFTRAFRAATGSTPHQFLVARRLVEVQSLLRMTSEGLKEIAAKTGFGDAFHLSHAFKAAYGVSPLVFRRQTLRP